MIKFEINKVYTTRSPGDLDCIITTKIVKRTAKTVTTEDGKRFRVREWQGVELFMPWGCYSMAPVMSADRLA